MKLLSNDRKEFFLNRIKDLNNLLTISKDNDLQDCLTNYRYHLATIENITMRDKDR